MLPEDATLEMKFSLNLFFPYEEKKSYQWTLTMRMSYILVFFQDSGTTKKAKQKPPCMTNFSSQSWYPWEVGQASLVVNLVLCIQNYQQESHHSLQATRCDSTMRMRVSQAKKYWVNRHKPPLQEDKEVTAKTHVELQRELRSLYWSSSCKIASRKLNPASMSEKMKPCSLGYRWGQKSTSVSSQKALHSENKGVHMF